jgi:5-formyltetrahydrofolate cyclo-ligase
MARRENLRLRQTNITAIEIEMESRRGAVLTKKQLRSKILFRLKIQKEENRDQKSRLIKEKLFRLGVFKRAKRVMFYLSFGGEVKTTEMIKEAKKSGKIITVPVCRKNRMLSPCLLRKGARLIRGPYGVWEPVAKQCVEAQDIDLVIVPGLAFDKRGRRLGRGKGYYDRFLKRLPAKAASIGLAFDFQILPLIPATATDVNVDKVIFA